MKLNLQRKLTTSLLLAMGLFASGCGDDVKTGAKNPSAAKGKGGSGEGGSGGESDCQFANPIVMPEDVEIKDHVLVFSNVKITNASKLPNPVVGEMRVEIFEIMPVGNIGGALVDEANRVGHALAYLGNMDIKSDENEEGESQVIKTVSTEKVGDLERRTTMVLKGTPKTITSLEFEIPYENSDGSFTGEHQEICVTSMQYDSAKKRSRK